MSGAKIVPPEKMPRDGFDQDLDIGTKFFERIKDCGNTKEMVHEACVTVAMDLQDVAVNHMESFTPSEATRWSIGMAIMLSIINVTQASWVAA